MPGPRTPPRVLVVGDAMTDVIVRPDGPLVRGSDRRAAIRTHPGGSGANQAAWLGHFEVPVRFVARVGAADAADWTAELAHHSVESCLAADSTLPTGSIVTILDPDGERSFFTDRGANDVLGPADLPDSLLDGVSLVHVSGYALVTPGPRAAVLDLVGRARARNIAVSIDPASASFLAEIGPAAFLDWTAGADLCFPNADEAALLAGSADRARQRAVLAGRYGTVVIKRGADGAEIATAEAVTALPAPRIRPVDTTGAGDAFLAAFLAQHLAGASPAQSLKFAIDAGAAATLTFGGPPPRKRL